MVTRLILQFPKSEDIEQYIQQQQYKVISNPFVAGRLQKDATKIASYFAYKQVELQEMLPHLIKALASTYTFDAKQYPPGADETAINNFQNMQLQKFLIACICYREMLTSLVSEKSLHRRITSSKL